MPKAKSPHRDISTPANWQSRLIGKKTWLYGSVTNESGFNNKFPIFLWTLYYISLYNSIHAFNAKDSIVLNVFLGPATSTSTTSIIMIKISTYHYDDNDMEEAEVLWKCGLLRSNLVSTVVRGEPTKVLRGQGGRTRSVLCWFLFLRLSSHFLSQYFRFRIWNFFEILSRLDLTFNKYIYLIHI